MIDSEACQTCGHELDAHDEPGEEGFAWCEQCDDLCLMTSPSGGPS